MTITFIVLAILFAGWLAFRVAGYLIARRVTWRVLDARERLSGGATVTVMTVQLVMGTQKKGATYIGRGSVWYIETADGGLQRVHDLDAHLTSMLMSYRWQKDSKGHI